MQKIVIGPIARRLTVGKRLLDRRAVKEGLNEIAAFPPILMFGKVRGNRHPMIFYGVACADQLLLLRGLMVIRDLCAGIEIMSA